MDTVKWDDQIRYIHKLDHRSKVLFALDAALSVTRSEEGRFCLYIVSKWLEDTSYAYACSQAADIAHTAANLRNTNDDWAAIYTGKLAYSNSAYRYENNPIQSYSGKDVLATKYASEAAQAAVKQSDNPEQLKQDLMEYLQELLLENKELGL